MDFTEKVLQVHTGWINPYEVAAVLLDEQNESSENSSRRKTAALTEYKQVAAFFDHGQAASKRYSARLSW